MEKETTAEEFLKRLIENVEATMEEKKEKEEKHELCMKKIKDALKEYGSETERFIVMGIEKDENENLFFKGSDKLTKTDTLGMIERIKYKIINK